MQQNKKLPSDNYIKHAVKTMSWQPTMRNGWIIKFSVYDNGSNILLLFVSNHTGYTIIRNFADENEAVDFINYVIELDPTDYRKI
jgi:hypothetical protein